MYLSKVHLDWTHARNPYDWHRALWRLFPELAQEERSFLFRVEQQLPGKGALVLLQSPTAPSPYDTEVRIIAEPKRLVLSELPAGMPLRFRLTANVIKTIRDSKDPARPVRVPLIKEEQQVEWLRRKLAEAATVEAVTTTPNPPLFFRRKGQGGKLVTTTFEGRLRVLDHQRFRFLIEEGVGAGKSFGCGLVSLARAR